MSAAWNSLTGENRPLTVAEEARVEADRVASVSTAREFRRAEFRSVASAGIKVAVGTTKTGEDLYFHELNLLGKALKLSRKENKGQAIDGEIAELNALEAIGDVTELWRAAENAASALLDAAGVDGRNTVLVRLAEINAVIAKWPS